MAKVLLVLQGVLGEQSPSQWTETGPDKDPRGPRSDRVSAEVVRIPPRLPDSEER